MAKTEYDPDMQPIPIRSYTNAFDMQVFGESTKTFIVDWLSMTLVIEVIIILLGKIYPIDLFYKWLWVNEYYLIQYGIIPVFLPFVIIKLTNRDGVGFWRWITVLIANKFSTDHFSPYAEPGLKEQIEAKFSGEED